MKKLIYSALMVATFLFIANTVSAQSRVLVDPGFSVNNYKHPNKARKAKAVQAAPDEAAANAVVQPRLGNRFSHTPKYANRPGSRVFLDTESGREMYLNPLDDSNHYKTRTNANKSEGVDARYAVRDSAQKDETVRID